MCTNMRWVKNPYLHTSILVPCGHCPACQQQKANARASRIKNNLSKGKVNLFVTLTYKNEFVPYIDRREICWRPDVINVYRNCSIRKVRKGSDYSIGNKYEYGRTLIDEIPASSDFYKDGFSSSLRDINGMMNCISVCYYKDIQNFYKRLRQNLKRKFNYDKPFDFFQCSEYGPTTMRAHFHGLLTVDACDIDLFKEAIIESWPFDSIYRRRRGIEVAKDASSYVASYVNKSHSLSSLLSQNPFRQKHSYSEGYGMGNVNFSLSEIQKKVSNGYLEFDCVVPRDGVPEIASLSIPKYVINRYFPKFKGYSRLTNNQIRELLLNPRRYARYAKVFDLNQRQIHEVITRLENSWMRYQSLTNCRLRYSYADAYIDTWSCFERTKFKRFYEGLPLLPANEWYDNLGCVASGLIEAPTLLPILDNPIYDTNPDAYDPNKFTSRVELTRHLEDLFYKKEKTRKVTNHIMASIGCYV